MSEYKKCPLCESTRFEPHDIVYCDGITRTMQRCYDCRTVYTVDAPPPPDHKAVVRDMIKFLKPVIDAVGIDEEIAKGLSKIIASHYPAPKGGNPHDTAEFYEGKAPAHLSSGLVEAEPCLCNYFKDMIKRCRAAKTEGEAYDYILDAADMIENNTALSSQPDKYREALAKIGHDLPNVKLLLETQIRNIIKICDIANAALKEDNHGKNPDLPSFEDVRGIYPKEDK